jgi:phosphatidylinositol 4-kinase
MEDRKNALRESLAELNSQLAASQSSGGICFPMGKGLYRVVHIPEDEAVLLNSREKAPYLICVEVLKGENQSSNSQNKDTSSHKLSRGGIPLANGDVQLQRPPPWAFPLWNQHDAQRNSTDQMLRSASQAIDQAMTHLWETKVKFVHVSLSVDHRSVQSSSENNEPGVISSKPVNNDLHKHTEQMTSNSLRVNDVKTETEDGDRLRDAGSTHQAGNSEQLADEEWISVTLTAVPGVNMEDLEDQEPAKRKEHRRVPSTIAMAEVKAAAAKGEAPLGLPVKKGGHGSSTTNSEGNDGGQPKATDALAGELWEVKRERIRKASIYGKLPGWDLRSIIVKSGDDCRQEHLAVQLISHFYDIFQEAGLPLWLRPYEVLVTSSYTALIETIPDTASIHAIKSRHPNLTSLREFFSDKYKENSPSFKLAQRNFVESMAGYSILCYLLQVKDRHNGNLLMDEEGHIIHIDFGFMVSNSPGGVNFESAPFKLTRELLEVMDSDAEGSPSEFFDYFKVLCIQGFLTCRKHAERIILLVEMLQDSGFPCFKGGPKTIQNLRKRFHLSLTEEQCVSLVLSLISSSLDAWRTRQYDYYQRVLNGIL